MSSTRVQAQHQESTERSSKLLLIAVLCLPIALNFWVFQGHNPARHNSDFAAFYTASKVYQSFPHDQLYNVQIQAAMEREMAGRSHLAFYHLPYEVILWLPLAHFPYATALWLWRAISLILLAIASGLLTKSIARRTGFATSLALSLAFFPLALSLANGQDSILLLLVFSASLLALSRHREMLAGLLLSLGLFKFQVVLPIAFVFLLQRRWRFAAGLGYGSILVLLASLWMVGYSGLRQLLALILQTQTTEKLGAHSISMVNIRGLTQLCLGSVRPAVLALIVLCISALVILVAVRITRGNITIAFVGLIPAAILVSYHLNLNDLVLLLLPILLVLERRAWTAPQGWKVMVPIILLFQTPLYIVVMVVGPWLATLAVLVAALWYGLWANFGTNSESELIAISG